MLLDFLDIKENNGRYEFKDADGNKVSLTEGQLVEIRMFSRRLSYKEMIRNSKEYLDEGSINNVVEYMDDRYLNTDDPQEEEWMQEAFYELGIE